MDRWRLFFLLGLVIVLALMFFQAMKAGWLGYERQSKSNFRDVDGNRCPRSGMCLLGGLLRRRPGCAARTV